MNKSRPQVSVYFLLFETSFTELMAQKLNYSRMTRLHQFIRRISMKTTFSTGTCICRTCGCTRSNRMSYCRNFPCTCSAQFRNPINLRVIDMFVNSLNKSLTSLHPALAATMTVAMMVANFIFVF